MHIDNLPFSECLCFILFFLDLILLLVLSFVQVQSIT